MKAPRNYFNQLNYTLANEDTALELALLPEGANYVLSVAGSGARVLPLLAKNPERLTCVDRVPEQLYLTELRIESARELERADFLAFWGYPPRSAAASEREALYRRVEKRMSRSARQFSHGLFRQLGWQSILYQGRWEKTFIRLSRVNRRIVGARGLGLFDALSPEEQARYLREVFPKKAWRAVLLLLGNASIFNALLYRGSFPKKNIGASHFRFYSKVFDHLFEQGLARESFFLQLLFFGKVVFSEGCPIECRPDVYSAARACQTDVTYLQGDLIETAAAAASPIDFLSLSDVPSYFTGELEREFLQKIAPALAPGALVVLRNYLHIPEGLILDGYARVTEDHRAAIDAEKLGVYLIDIFRRESRADSQAKDKE